MRGKNIVQLIRTLGLLSRPMGVTRKEMAAGLGICVRSVSRSTQAVEELGIPVYDYRSELEKSLEVIKEHEKKEYLFFEGFTKELDIDRDPKALFIQENILKRL